MSPPGAKPKGWYFVGAPCVVGAPGLLSAPIRLEWEVSRGWIFSSSRRASVASAGASAVRLTFHALFSLFFPDSCRVCGAIVFHPDPRSEPACRPVHWRRRLFSRAPRDRTLLEAARGEIVRGRSH